MIVPNPPGGTTDVLARVIAEERNTPLGRLVVVECHPGAEAVSWFGVLTTAGTPKAIVDRLNGAMVAVIRKPEVQARMADVGAEAVGSAEEFAKLIRSEIDKWGKVIQEAANVKPGS